MPDVDEQQPFESASVVLKHGMTASAVLLDYRPAGAVEHKPDTRRLPEGPSLFTGFVGMLTGIALPYLILANSSIFGNEYGTQIGWWLLIALPICVLGYRIGSNSSLGSWCCGFTLSSATNSLIVLVIYLYIELGKH